MTFEQNVRAVLECNFTETKEEIVNIACNKICELCKNLLEEFITKIEKQEMDGKGTASCIYNNAIEDAVMVIFDYKEEQLYEENSGKGEDK